MPISIMLDAGHGGQDPGAVYNGRQEKDDTLNLVLRLGEILQQRGFDIQYTRTTDIYESPFQKATEANVAGVDYFVSIHRNSFPTPNTAQGVESLVYNKTGIKYELAQNINAALADIGFINLGVTERPNLVVLRRTQMPAVLVEVGFINSDSDNALFDNNFDAIATAIADGITETLNGNTTTQGMSYQVQVGSFRNELYAARLLQELLRQNYPARIEDSDGFYRVRVGSFGTLDQAVQMERRLKRSGYPTWVVTSY